MGEIIAGTYVLEREIGSGGGGVVYLGKHLRLGKQVVLKADKRKLSTSPEVLRREVDALKNLSHTYIPQVYDFVEENGAVYTVMDYIEGESLDKPLNRGERFSQPQVIEWACELLEALVYLHSRPPHGILHADIKPANIMRTPEGDIRLIDFNIALALGEEGAVRVGLSRGYASPEHYGLDRTAQGLWMRKTAALEPTELVPSTLPPTVPDSVPAWSVSASGKKIVLLDVRSDIYSLGATLYHLLSGRRPAQDAKEVQPLAAEPVSPAVAAIIQKAMDPDPDQRYQTAAEMLSAFEHLHENDPRTKRHKRRTAMAAGLLAALFLAGGVCTFTGLKQMERAEELGRIAAETAEKEQAAVSASEDAYRRGDIPKAVRSAVEALNLNAPSSARAQKALTGALGVYELSDGFQPYRSLTLPSAPLKTALSPAGTRAAALVSGKLLVFDTETGSRLAVLETEPSALSDVVFIEEDTVLYAGAGALRAYSLSEQRELWAGKPATGVTLSADGSTAAAVYRDENIASIYDARTGQAVRTISFQNKRQRIPSNDVFADPGDNLFALSGDGSWLAVSFSDGGLRVFDIRDSAGDLDIFDTSGYTHFEGGFYGRYFAFSAFQEGESVFAVVDMETGTQTGGFSAPNPFRVRTDEKGIFLSLENLLVQLEPVTGEQTERAYTDADIAAFSQSGEYTLTALDNGMSAFFDGQAELLGQYAVPADFTELAGEYALLADRNTPSLRLLRLETHPEAQLFRYDRAYLHSEARVSGTGNVLLFRYDAFRLYSPDGTILADVNIPDAAQVYDQQYRRDSGGDYLEVIYNDGIIRRYSAVDGSLLATVSGTVPDGTLHEEFLTDKLRIDSPLHGTPTAYDRETGELIRELEKDDYLAYVTQTGEYVITEYVSTQGERYGLLLDEHCEVLAELPALCDILPDGTLVFDDMRGNLRQSRIYSTQELMALGKIYQGGT